MSKYKLARLSFVPRPNKVRQQSKKILGKNEQELSMKAISSSRVSPLVFSTRSIAPDSYSQKALVTEQADKLQQSSPSVLIDDTAGSKISTEKVDGNLSKAKTRFPLTLGSTMGILAAVLGLAAVAMSIYTLVITLSTTTTTTMSTTITVTPTLRWNSSGITLAGTGALGTAANQLNGPLAIVLDSSNTLYIADQNNSRVQKWASNAWVGSTIAGQASAATGSTSTFLNKAGGIAIDSIGGVYVADIYNCRVQYWPSGASTGTMVAGTGVCGTSLNQLNYPYSVIRDSSSGTLYIADTLNHRVVRYLLGASSGTVVAGGAGAGTSSTQLNYPITLYFDSSSNSLVVANAGANNIVRWTIGASSWTLMAGSPTGAIGTASTMLYYPVSMSFDLLGNMYVADTYNNRIQFFSAGSQSGTTILGVTSVPGNNASLLNNPYAVIADSSLNLYVADALNHRIQKFIRY